MRTTKCNAFHKLTYPKKCVFCINGALIAFTTGLVPEEEEKDGGVGAEKIDNSLRGNPKEKFGKCHQLKKLIVCY